MPIPQNAQAIYQFLTGNGYTPNAAAGIVGNIEQESGGNPAEPGGGLIQILAGGPGYTSSTSLSAQLQSILGYNNAQGSSLINQLNSQPSPQAAALFYSQNFERPLASAANNANREQSAIDVANAAKTGNWSVGGPNQPAETTAASGGLLDIPSEITTFFKDADSFVTKLIWLLNPANWIRIGSFLTGIILVAAGIYALLKVSSDEPLVSLPKVVPIPV